MFSSDSVVDRVPSSVKRPEVSSIYTANRSCMVFVSLRVPSHMSRLLTTTPPSEMCTSALISFRVPSTLIVRTLCRATY